MFPPTLTRYVLINFWKTMLLVIATFLGLILFADIVDHLDDFLSYDVPFWDYFLYLAWTTPNVFNICLPFSVQLAGLAFFRQLSTNNCYIALVNGGVALKTIMTPIIVSGIFLSLFSFYLSLEIVPHTRFSRKVFQKEKLRMHRPIIYDRNIIGSDGRKYYVNKYHKKDRKIEGLMVTKSNESGTIVNRVFAKEVVWNKEISGWDGTDVVFQDYIGDGIPGKKEIVKNIGLGSMISPDEILLSKDREMKYLTHSEMKSMAQAMPESQSKLKQELWLNYYRKYSNACVPLVFLLLAIPFGITPVRETSMRLVGIGIVLSISYYIVDALFFQAGKGMVVGPFMATWASNIIFGLVGFHFLYRAPQ